MNKIFLFNHESDWTEGVSDQLCDLLFFFYIYYYVLGTFSIPQFLLLQLHFFPQIPLQWDNVSILQLLQLLHFYCNRNSIMRMSNNPAKQFHIEHPVLQLQIADPVLFLLYLCFRYFRPSCAYCFYESLRRRADGQRPKSDR